jgi:hypothetical protein
VAEIARLPDGTELRLDGRERELLLDIVDRLSAQLGTVPRSSPRAYEDAELEAEYRRLAQPDFESTRLADIELVRSGLAAGRDELILQEDETLAWIRALNHLRLVAGGLIGIEADGWESAADETTLARPEYDMLIALGWLQEGLVSALSPAGEMEPGDS